MPPDAATADDPPARVLVVDDEEPIRRTLVRLLKRKGYECVAAANADEARSLAGDGGFELVLADMNMPGDSGITLIGDLLKADPDMAAIMVTGEDDTALAELALETGAYGYIIKPFEPNEILIDVSNALRRRGLEIENREHRRKLESMVKERTADLWKAVQELEQARDDLRSSQAETVERLSIAAEFRDDETARHIHRMSEYCSLLAVKTTGDAEHAALVRIASVMHDVGKIGIPDRILLKPGKLTPDEYEQMKQHAEYGYKILAGGRSRLLELAATIALTHHEKWDGSGYPRGLAGSDIPLEGRMAAIADVFDAITTDRVYRKAYPLGEALTIMRDGKGTHFDPDLVDRFFDSIDEALKIKEANE
ncbi:MAG TPA: HD domain-containing phosphohydrolase [Actinomycetota bacterium]|nr:HD domain-containing phosphohydrolase [Actinomycetota bacterium]